MNDEEFQLLAMKVLAAESTPEEHSALVAELKRDTAREEEYNALRQTIALAQTAGSIAQSLESPASAELPSYRLAQLRSAVRSHFKKPVDHPASSRFHQWISLFYRRWTWAGGLLAACLIALLVLQSQPQEIEIGFYAQPITRSQAQFPPTTSRHGINVTTFDSDQRFDQWRNQSWRPNEKARLWLDDEHSLIHIRIRGRFLAPSKEYTLTLPESDAERATAIGQIIEKIR